MRRVCMQTTSAWIRNTDMNGDFLNFLVAFLSGGDQRLKTVDRTGRLTLEDHVREERDQGDDQSEGRRQKRRRDAACHISGIGQGGIPTEQFEALDDSDDCSKDAQQAAMR